MSASKLSLSFVLISLIFLTNACTQKGHYRTQVVIGEDPASVTDIICDVPAEKLSDEESDVSSEDLDIKEENKICKDMDHSNTKKVKQAEASIQHRHYRTSSPPKIHDYYLSFVEFDDQGWFQERKQMDALMNLLEKLNNQNEELLIFVFAHGWRHNSSACDNNVICFQRILERFDLLEDVTNDQVKKKSKYYQSLTKRKVVGVYLGWRGKSASVQPFEILSFWDRKNTAQRVGLGGTTELLTRLNDFRRYMNPKREAGKTQLVIMGHSFGGKVVYTALSHSLVERAVRKRGNKGDGENLAYKTANSFGDLIIL